MQQPRAPKRKPYILRPSRPRFIVVFVVVVVGVLAVLTLGIILPRETVNTPEQRVQRGLVLSKQQQYEAAIQEFTQAIEAQPSMVDAYLYRGMALYETGRFEDSIPDFSKVLNLRPERIAVYLYRGDSYLAAGQKDQAVADYQHVLALAGGDEQLATTARTKLFLMGESER
jgi:tetratricopeptide (TPR) repeat protein